MKIAVITAATNTIPRFRIDMLRSFKKAGCQIVVMGDEPEDLWKDYFSKEGMAYRQYFISRNGINPLYDLRSMRELCRTLRLERPDKVFTYQAKPNIYGCLSAHKVKTPEVYVMMGGLGSLFHDSSITSRMLRTIVSIQYRIALRYATRVFFQNQDDVDIFCDKKIVTQPKVVMTKGSGVNLEEYPQKPLPASPSFLFVGRLVRGKGVFEYLEACRKIREIYPHATCHLVGPLDSNPTSLNNEDLEPYVADGTIFYHGEQQDVRPYLEQCSTFVLPSYYGEGTPKSALEAMSVGRPLIVADAVGCREVVIPGVNGLLVPPKDTGALAEAMQSLVVDKELRTKMGVESRKLAEELFDVNKVNSVICRTMGIT